jgi:hypothetical protein
MLRTLAWTLSLAALVPFLLAGSPAVAATKAQRMETCKFGADHDKLTGKKRSDFMKHCMANSDYEPAARKKALQAAKKSKKTKKPATHHKMATPNPPVKPQTTTQQ